MKWLLLVLLAGPAFAQGYRPASPRAGSSAATWTSTQTDGGAAFVAPTGQRVCHDGAACGVYTVYDGGTLGLVGAEVDVPQGFTDSQKVNPDVIITPYSVVAQAASGQAAFKVAQTGARIYYDVGGNIYCYSSGSDIICAAGIKTGTLSADTYGTYTDSKVPLWFSLQLFPTSNLGTCDGNAAAGHNPEGTKKVLSASSTGTQSRECLCVSDGGGTPAWTWVNTGCPKTAGTSTTCPACP